MKTFGELINQIGPCLNNNYQKKVNRNILLYLKLEQDQTIRNIGKFTIQGLEI